MTVIGEIVAVDFVHHSWPWVSPGIKGLKELMTMVASGFSDLHYQIEDIVAEGDKVVLRVSESELHTGELLGIPVTGKRVNYTSIHILRIANGRIVEHWREQDTMSLMQQLGAIPS
jgi:predicted ester cyclase